jgi:flagellar biosynthesis/type III secretory pathway chaperone
LKDKQNELVVENMIISLINLYQQEVSRYQELLKLTNQQQKFIKNNEWDELNQVTEKKRNLMKKIDRLEEEVLEFQEQIAAELDLEIDDEFYPHLIKMELPKTEELYQVLQKVYNIMKQINKLNQKNQSKIKEEKNKKQQRLKEINRGMTVNSAYSGYSDTSEGKFFDKTD